jgi:hypothetical protein
MTPEAKQLITVTAKCPKCKRTKKYTSDNPPKTTPYCPHGCMMPMFVQNVEVKTLKTK